MFVRTPYPFGKSPSRPSPRHRRAKALPGAGSRPHIERLENRTLLSAANQALVAQMYQDLLQRPADDGGLANWTAALDHAASPTQVALSLAQSTEGQALQVESLYRQFLHRGADSAGLAGFTQALAAGQTLEQIAAALVASPEYYQSRGGSMGSGFLNALYQDALGRAVDASGAAAYGQALAGGTTRAQVAQAIFASAELQQDVVQHDYQYFLRRAADPAGLANWTQALQHGMRDEQIAAVIVGSREYAQNVQSAGRSLQQTLLPNNGFALPVLVTNTPSQPVPVTGTVQAQQSGPWTVGISGTPTVNVASSVGSPIFVRDVNNGVQPFQIMVDQIYSGPKSFQVPKDKRLVIEDVSAEAESISGSGPNYYFRLSTSTDGVNYLSHDIPLNLIFSIPVHDFFIGHDLTRIYADPGTFVIGDIVTGGSGVKIVRASMVISGYLVNVP
jgi:Domain of unknown function (DUF4214)